MSRYVIVPVVAALTLPTRILAAQTVPPDAASTPNPTTEPPAPPEDVSEDSASPEVTETTEQNPPADTASDESADAGRLETRIAELQAKLAALSAQIEQQELARLVEDAESEAATTEQVAPPEEREFLDGSLALQRLNPEITLSGDVLAQVVVDELDFYASPEDRSGLVLRGAGLHFEHVLDPYSKFKSALHFAEHGVGLEELYLSWFGVVPSLSLSVGRFRQNFGILNRWHEHDLDQTSYPTALTFVFGQEGLVGDGLMLKWMMPALWAHANELTLEVVNGSNETLFSGEYYSAPSSLLHLKNYWDLSASTYLELGLTGMFGLNNRQGFVNEDQELADEPWRESWVGGADLTLYWSPPERARYRSLTWRSELYYADQDLPAGSAPRQRQAWGVYSYLQWQLGARWFLGVRGDVAQPTLRAVEDPFWDVVPYVTFWQSEFVYLRLEAQHGEHVPHWNPDGVLATRDDNRVLLQIDFAAGPHKHEKY